MSASDWITTSVELRDDGVAVLTISGVIDLATDSALRGAIDDLLGKAVRALIVDLSEVDFMASVGLRILASTKARVGDAVRLAVVGSSPATRRPIQLTGLGELLGLCSTVEEAIEVVRATSVEPGLKNHGS